jgi:hypothetical protein
VRGKETEAVDREKIRIDRRYGKKGDFTKISSGKRIAIDMGPETL